MPEMKRRQHDKRTKKLPIADLDDLARLILEEFAQVDRRFDKVERCLDNVETIQIAMRSDVVILKGDIEIMKGDMETMKGDLRSLFHELHMIRVRLEALEEKVDGQSGFAKEIDWALERLATIEKHLGITPRQKK